MLSQPHTVGVHTLGSTRRLGLLPVLFGFVGLLLAALSLMAFPVAAMGKTSDDEDTASGECYMTGKITFTEPIGWLPEYTSFTDYAEGTCTGTVNGEFMADERAYLRARGGGLLSCTANRVTDPGTMYFTRNTATHSDDVQIDYIAHSQGAFGRVVSHIEGRIDGDGVATVQFRGDEDALRDCEAGRYKGGVYDTVGFSVNLTG
jgi:hypothetical protein